MTILHEYFCAYVFCVLLIDRNIDKYEDASAGIKRHLQAHPTTVKATMTINLTTSNKRVIPYETIGYCFGESATVISIDEPNLYNERHAKNMLEFLHIAVAKCARLEKIVLCTTTRRSKRDVGIQQSIISEITEWLRARNKDFEVSFDDGLKDGLIT